MFAKIMKKYNLPTGVLKLIVGTLFLTSTHAAAYLDTDYPNLAQATYEIQVPGKIQSEKCYILERFPETEYPALKDENKLCRYNLYNSSSTHPKNETLYGCPKVNNTSIAIELYEAPKGLSNSQFQKIVCPLTRTAKKNLKDQKGYPDKDAKFKIGSSGVSTASILGYYHLSNFLKAVETPAATLRTVDINTVLDHSLAGRYFAVAMKNQSLHDFWNNEISLLVKTKHGPLSYLPQPYTAPPFGLSLVPSSFYRTGSRTKLVPTSLEYWSQRQLTKDKTQVFGALSVNPSNEASYNEASGTKQAPKRVDQFRNSSVFYPGIKDPRPIEQILGSRDHRKVAQKLQGMQDTSSMLILDFLFDQSDRIGNIHYYLHQYYKDRQGDLHDISNKQYKDLLAKSAKDLTEEEKEILVAVKESGTPVKVMLLKDNDGGFDNNIAKKYHLIANVMRDPAFYESWKGQADLYLRATMVVRHFNPDVYKGVMKLYNWLFTDKIMQPKMDEYFLNVLQFTDSEYKIFRNNLLSLYRALYLNCKSGKIYLDLDTRNYFSSRPNNIQTSTPGVCEGFF